MDTDTLPDPDEKFFFHMNNFNDEVIDEDPPEESEDLPLPPPVFSESELESAKQKAFQEGHAAGKKEVEESRAQSLANLMQKLAHDLQMLFIAENEREAVFEREAVALCKVMFEHAFPAAQEQYGFAELESKMSEILATQHGQNSIEIRIAHDFAKGVEGFVEKLRAQNSDLRCDVVVDENIATGAFKLSWKDGGAAYNSNEIAQAILSNLDEILAGGAVPSHNDISEESNISGGDAPLDVTHDINDEPSKQTPDADNDPIAEDDKNDG